VIIGTWWALGRMAKSFSFNIHNLDQMQSKKAYDFVPIVSTQNNS